MRSTERPSSFTCYRRIRQYMDHIGSILPNAALTCKTRMTMDRSHTSPTNLDL